MSDMEQSRPEETVNGGEAAKPFDEKKIRAALVAKFSAGRPYDEDVALAEARMQEMREAKQKPAQAHLIFQRTYLLLPFQVIRPSY